MMDYADKVKVLREWSGEGIQLIRKALIKSNEDLFVAAGFLKYDGCAIASPNPNWALDKAKANAGDFVLSDEGKLIYKPKPMLAPHLRGIKSVSDDSKGPGER
jgi:hypothetical protein